MTQDAAKRADMLDQFFLREWGNIIGPFYMTRADVERVIDTAVAEAVKELEEKIARLKVERDETWTALQNTKARTVTYADKLAEAQREERERLRPLLVNRVEKFKKGDVVVHAILGNHEIEEPCDVCAVLGPPASAPFTEKGRATFGDAYPNTAPPSRVNPAPEGVGGETK